MFYKLSNIATVDELQNETKIPLQHPNLYQPEFVIDGLNEKNVLMRTNMNPNRLSVGIWGLLPENYNDEWNKFQRIANTLNFEVDKLRESSLFRHTLKNRRCAIVVTGFFTTLFKDGEIYPFHVHLNSNKPFYIAGVYSILSDGFMTCSMLVKKNCNTLNSIQNIDITIPIILNNQEADRWLDESIDESEVLDLIEKPSITMLTSDPVPSDIFDQFSHKNWTF